MLRVYASDPLYPRIAALAQVISDLTNPQLFWHECDGRGSPRVERMAALAWAKEQMRIELEELTR